jgi:hypothetical protein
MGKMRTKGGSMARQTHDETGETHDHGFDTGRTVSADTVEVHETATPDTVLVGPGPGAVVTRMLLTILGAAGMVVGAFLEWVGGEPGTDLSYRVFFQPTPEGNPVFLTSAGFVVIAIAVVALLGLAGNWITRLAGALGIAAFVLFAISVYRAERTSAFFESIDIGAWLVLAGSVVALIGGFAGTRRVVSLPA